LIILISLGEEYKLWNSSLCSTRCVNRTQNVQMPSPWFSCLLDSQVHYLAHIILRLGIVELTNK
jgi:hypothetical protein